MNPYQSPAEDQDFDHSCALNSWVGMTLVTIGIGGIFAFGTLLGAVITGWAR